jgi:uncharacterized repeat protein (TIGR02543 family)
MVETCWVQADSSNVLIDTRDWVYLTLAFQHGTVNGAGPGQYQYVPNATAELSAAAAPGYVFSGWSGAAGGTDNPLSLLMDFDKSVTAVFDQDTADPDADDLTNYQEIVVYQSNPGLWDSDEDGFGDGYEVFSGFSPTSATSTPDTRMVIYTAVEVQFGAALGQSYRVESSTDLQTWVPVESGIAGTGGSVTRLYSIQLIPHRYFRAVRE